MKLTDYPACPRPRHPLWQMHVPVLSTRHLLRTDALTLESLKEESPLLFPASPSSGYLLVIEDWEQDDRFGPDLNHLGVQFSGLGYRYLRFDSAGDLLEGCPQHDW